MPRAAQFDRVRPSFSQITSLQPPIHKGITVRIRHLSLLAGIALMCGHVSSQVNWTQRKPAGSPPALSDHVMVGFLGRAYLFGGAMAGSVLSNQTWLWNGTTWKKLAPKVSPAARMRSTGAYDMSRGRFVLFGGSTGLSTGLMKDTWEFDGTAWVQVKTTSAPSARNDAAMAYDSVRHRIVLLGGRDSTGTLNDHWEYDGKNWTQIKPKTLPTSRRDHTLVYDSGRHVMIAFGGFHTGLKVRNDLWEYDGKNWKLATPPASPGPRVGHAAAYDSYRRVMVVSSGYDGSAQPADTLEWNGIKWVQRNPKTFPPGRSGHTMVYDFIRHQMIQYGGWSTKFTNETWSYTNTQLATHTTYGNGCKSSAGVPTLDLVSGALPWTGHVMKVEVSNIPKTSAVLMMLGGSDKVWGPLKLPLDLKGLGMPTCKLLASPEFFGLAPNNQGLATWSLLIPNDTTLSGATFFHQALVFEKGANAFGAVVSDAGKAKVGVK